MRKHVILLAGLDPRGEPALTACGGVETSTGAAGAAEKSTPPAPSRCTSARTRAARAT